MIYDPRELGSGGAEQAIARLSAKPIVSKRSQEADGDDGRRQALNSFWIAAEDAKKIRELRKVSEGLLWNRVCRTPKKIQVEPVLPWFAAYRSRFDLRAADVA